jgi:hypothetical protein
MHKLLSSANASEANNEFTKLRYTYKVHGVPWQDMQHHEMENCHFRQVFCRLECGKAMPWHKRPAHEVHLYLYTYICMYSRADKNM